MVTMTYNNRKKFAERIKNRRHELGLIQEDLARLVGINRGYVGAIETGRYIPAANVLVKLAEVLGENPSEYLEYRIREHKTVESKAWTHLTRDSAWKAALSPEHAPTVSGRATRTIPVINIVECGNWADFSDLDYPVGIGKEFAYTDSVDPNAFFLTAHGDSMENEIFDGDELLIEPNTDVENGDIVLARIDEGCMVKRFERLDENTVLLKAQNSKYQTIIVRAADHPEFKCFPVMKIQRRTRREKK